MHLTQAILDRFVCPVCLSPLLLGRQAPPAYIDCTACHRRYPIVDGLPVLIGERASMLAPSSSEPNP